MKYIKFMLFDIKIRMAYRSRYMISIISSYIQIISAIFIWLFVLKNNNGNINGYSGSDMIKYIVLSFTILSFLNNSIDRNISSDIERGDIVMYFIKPISYIGVLISQSISNVLFDGTFLLLPCVFIVTYFGGISISPLMFFLFLISILFSGIILFLLNFIVGLTSFYINYIWGFLMMKEVIFRFTSGELFPLSFLPEGLRNFLSLTPFEYISYKPIMLLMGKLDFSGVINMLIVQVIWIGILLGLSKLQWFGANKKISVNGG